MSVADQPSRKPGKRRYIAIAAVVVLLVLASVAFLGSIFTPCGLVCGPANEPAILNAYVSQSGAITDCIVGTLSFTPEAICSFATATGASGVIVVNMTSQNGDSRVQFANYSSSASARIVSTPPCMYPSSVPELGSNGCIVSEGGSIFRFNFTIGQGLPLGGLVSFVIAVTKTCCLP